MMYDTRAPFRGPNREWYQPPEPNPDCECDPDDDHLCDICARYDEDYMKDPDRARDEQIAMEIEDRYNRDCYD